MIKEFVNRVWGMGESSPILKSAYVQLNDALTLLPFDAEAKNVVPLKPEYNVSENVLASWISFNAEHGMQRLGEITISRPDLVIGHIERLRWVHKILTLILRAVEDHHA